MHAVITPLRETLIGILDELPPEEVAELLDFALFLKQRSGSREGSRKLLLKTLPAAHLDQLAGLVAWGGDALADTEEIYEI